MSETPIASQMSKTAKTAWARFMTGRAATMIVVAFGIEKGNRLTAYPTRFVSR